MNLITKIAASVLLAGTVVGANAATTATPAANSEVSAKCDKAAMDKHLAGAAKETHVKKCMEKAEKKAK